MLLVKKYVGIKLLQKVLINIERINSFNFSIFICKIKIYPVPNKIHKKKIQIDTINVIFLSPPKK
jgi:hypothetical protein